MRFTRARITATLLCLYCSVVNAQQPQPTAAVPKLVRFSGSFRPANGLPAQPPGASVEGVTLAVYRDQTGGEALWSELQNVVVDADGHYSVLMGATRSEGMPIELFASGEPRWLGAQFNRPGDVEQPRLLLVSVPYALKASDAETLGGRPASAYLLAEAPAGASGGLDRSSVSLAAATTPGKSAKATTPVNSGIPNYIAMFANSTDVGNSVMYQANGAIGIGTTVPGISLDVRTGALPQLGVAGFTDYLTFFASDQYGPAWLWFRRRHAAPWKRGDKPALTPYGFLESMRIQSSTGSNGNRDRPASKAEQ